MRRRGLEPPRESFDTAAANAAGEIAAERQAAGRPVEIVGATAPDGTVESVWDPAARFCLGIQWHPAVLTHRPEQVALFDRLVLAARGRAVLAVAA